MSLKDKNGFEVKVGCRVKVLTLDPEDFQDLDEEGVSEVMSMVGEILEVYEVDEYGQAWVTKEWWYAEDDMMSRSVGLSAHEMEIQHGNS